MEEVSSESSYITILDPFLLRFFLKNLSICRQFIDTYFEVFRLLTANLFLWWYHISLIFLFLCVDVYTLEGAVTSSRLCGLALVGKDFHIWVGMRALGELGVAAPASEWHNSDSGSKGTQWY